MRKQYHLKKSKKGFFAWDVDKLIAKSKGLKAIDIQISDLYEFEQNYWYQDKIDKITCKSITNHIKLVLDCKLEFPIILAADGSIMDGMHRVCKAYLNGQKLIKAVKFDTTPEPDFIDILPEELSYDR